MMTMDGEAMNYADELNRPGVRELIEMYHVYRNVCTQQEEKFIGFDLPYTWDDAHAAWQLLREMYPEGTYWFIWDTWRNALRAAGLWYYDVPLRRN